MFFFRVKIVVFVQSGSIRVKGGCIRIKWLYSNKCCIRAKWLYLGNSGFIRSKEVVFGKNLLYSGKHLLYSVKGVVFGKSG